MSRLTAVALVLAIGAATLQLGGRAPGAAPLVTALGALLAATLVLRNAHAPSRLEPRLVLVLALAGAPLAVGTLELVPLPRSIVASLAPRTAALHEACDRAEGVTVPPARPLSLEPATSRAGLERGAALLALFVLGAALARREADAYYLAQALIVLGVVVALDALLLSSGATGSDAWSGRARAPFKNPNHLATFLGLLLPLALGVALGRLGSRSMREERGSAPELVIERLVALAAAALAAAAIVQSQSRAGVAAASAGTLAALAGARALARRRLAAATAILIVLAVGVTWVYASANAERFKGSSEALGARAEYWKLGLRVLDGRALTGSGLGTFDDASFAELTSATASVLFLRPERAHNDYLNLATDLGVPAALAGIAAVFIVMATAVSRLRDLHGERRTLAAGALGGAVAALVQALFDFGLELAPVAALFAVVLGLAWGLTAPEPASGGSRPVRVAAGMLLFAIALLGFLSVLGERAADAAGDDLGRLAAARRFPADDAELAVRHSRLALRAHDLETAIDAGREAVALAPGSAPAQAQLALALLEGAYAREELRREGEERLALALTLGPSWSSLHYTAGCYWLDRTAATNARSFEDRAAKELRAAAALRLPDEPDWRSLALARVRKLLEEGKLGALGEALLTRLAAPPAPSAAQPDDATPPSSPDDQRPGRRGPFGDRSLPPR